jgi:UV DNA damage endonuclease
MMLEIKDKEASAIKAIGILRELGLVPPAPIGYEAPVFAPRPALTDAEGRLLAPAPKPRKATKKVTTPPTEAEAPAPPKAKRAAKTK